MFTLTDSALRMLVLLYFHQLGFSPIKLASIFLLYEFLGISTNLFGGWLALRLGLNNTMNFGLLLQIVALSILILPLISLSIPLIMLSQALAGIAKDLNKMSAKSSVKILLIGSKTANLKLFWWVSILTGSKNSIKGIGFFLGGLLLSLLGFDNALLTLVFCLILVLLASLILLDRNTGKNKSGTKITHLFSKTTEINLLSIARLFLFGARDIWFVVALPIYLMDSLKWSFSQVGAFFAFWVIGYGLIQAVTPKIIQTIFSQASTEKSSYLMILLLMIIPLLIALLMQQFPSYQASILLLGLCVFGFVFAINSSIHSYLIVSFAELENTSVDVGFYYSANAAGRLFGTLLSGVIYQKYGMMSCLLASGLFLFVSFVFSLQLSYFQDKKRAVKPLD